MLTKMIDQKDMSEKMPQSNPWQVYYFAMPGIKKEPEAPLNGYHAQDICDAFCANTKVPFDSLIKTGRAGDRSEDRVTHRHALIWFLLRYTKWSTTLIGNLLHVDHSLVCHARKKINDHREVYPHLVEWMDSIDPINGSPVKYPPLFALKDAKALKKAYTVTP